MSTPQPVYDVSTLPPALAGYARNVGRFAGWRERRAAARAARTTRTTRAAAAAATSAAQALAASPAANHVRKVGTAVLLLLAACAGALVTLAVVACRNTARPA
jgi:hypothetical protein